jgi:hypothetical protein
MIIEMQIFISGPAAAIRISSFFPSVSKSPYKTAPNTESFRYKQR